MRISDWSSDVCSSDLRSSDSSFQSVSRDAGLFIARMRLFELATAALTRSRSDSSRTSFSRDIFAGRRVRSRRASASREAGIGYGFRSPRDDRRVWSRQANEVWGAFYCLRQKLSELWQQRFT